MKVTRKDLPATFTPVTLELTIESESELRTLYTLFNMPDATVVEASSKEGFEVQNLKDVADTYDIYEVIESICEERL